MRYITWSEKLERLDLNRGGVLILAPHHPSLTPLIWIDASVLTDIDIGISQFLVCNVIFVYTCVA